MSRFSTVIPTYGPAGNIFEIAATALRLMRELGVPLADQNNLVAEIAGSHSYKAAKALVREWFPLEEDEQ